MPTLLLSCTMILNSCSEKEHIYNVSDYLEQNNADNLSPILAEIVADIKEEVKQGEKVTIQFDNNTYNFREEGSTKKEYYISNHDQDNPKSIGVNIEEIDNLTIDGNGSTFLFHGRMLPIVISKSANTTLENFIVDFATPHIGQARVIENKDGFISYIMAPWSRYKIVDDALVLVGDGWEHTPAWGIAFDPQTRRVVYNTSDIALGVKGVKELSDRVIKAKWDNPKLVEGTVIAMRGYGRPTPGIFLDKNKDTNISEVTIQYAEGMGLLAQLCENITLYKFKVALDKHREEMMRAAMTVPGMSISNRVRMSASVALTEDHSRFFTTQADATHFSGCKGEIISTHGVYENMMDDAINVHGTYLKVIKRVSDTKLIGRYMHSQAWGFEWGFAGDSVQFISSKTMDLVDSNTSILSIKAVDKPTAFGAKEFEIEFADKISSEISEQGSFGIENLEWTPSVIFSDNIIRNNRARGVLFSTPKPVIVERNIFDHTSGTAILLCGDCNGWYETGACRDVIIKNNQFIGSLTNMFQFTNAIISIYPEIPDLQSQTKYFHGGKGEKGVVIENNYFETFDNPIVYAKSLDGLIFKDNTIVQNEDYEPFHWNTHRFLFERVTNYTIEGNKFSTGFDKKRDIKLVN